MFKNLSKIQVKFNNKNSYLYIYALLFGVCFFIMIGQNYRLEAGNDDVFHSQLINQFGSAFNFMIEQYNNWNSRYFTSFMMAYIMDKNIWLWRILNTFVLFGLILYSSKLINNIYNTTKNIYIIIILGVFSTFALLSSGIWTQSITWVTGSFNYLWASSALVISFYYLFKYIFNHKSIKLYQFILLIPVVLYANNTEQTTLIFITMYIICIIYSLIKYHSFSIYLFILFLIGVISAYFVFTSPSIPIRYASEIKTWYPLFNELPLYIKALHGYSYTVLHGILLNDYPNTILLSILLFIIIKNQYNNKVYNILALLPAFYSLIFYIGRINTEWRDNLLIYNLKKFSSKYLDNNLNEPFISVIIGTIILILMIYFIFKINWSSFERKYLILIFFAAAIMSSFVLSFSPTIYASGERVFFIPYTMYILTIGMVFIEALKYINFKSKKFMVIFIIYCLVGVIDVFSKVYR